MTDEPCTICPSGTVMCTHFGEHIVRLEKRPGGYYAVERLRNGWNAEGHVGGLNYLETYQKQVEYIRRQP